MNSTKSTRSPAPVTEKADGRIAATAKLGFDTQTIDDVEQALNNVTIAAQ